ncbi:MAG TPA: hypothetical protein VL651_12250 [Bacteroidia bacterium]|nr:hypothetical protein [Bacteroidia bacterium]
MKIAFWAGPLFEFLQLLKIIPGTFDLLDLFTFLLFGSIALLITNRIQNEIHFVKPLLRKAGMITGTFAFVIVAMATEPTEPPGQEPVQLINSTNANMIVLIQDPGDSSTVVLDSAFFVNGDTIGKSDMYYFKFFRYGDKRNRYWHEDVQERSIISFLPDSFFMTHDHALKNIEDQKMRMLDRSISYQKMHAPYSCLMKWKNDTAFVLSIRPGENLPILEAESGTNEHAPKPLDYMVSFWQAGKLIKLSGTGNEIAQQLRDSLPNHGVYDLYANNLLTVTNKTGKPVKVFEEGVTDHKLDSGYYGVIYSWPKEATYYVFLENEWGMRLPGIFEAKKMDSVQFRNWVDVKRMQPFDMDTFFFNKKYYVNTDPVKNIDTYWLNTDQSFPLTRIPLQDGYYADSLFSSFTFIIDRQSGKKDTLRLHGQEFYAHMNTKGEFILK